MFKKVVSPLIVLLLAFSFSSYITQADTDGVETIREDENNLIDEEPVAHQQQVEESDKKDLVVVDANENHKRLPDVPADNAFDFIRIFAGLYYQNSYKHINNYLVDNVETDDVAANLRAASEFYEKVRVNSWNIFNKHLVGALEQFTALNRILSGEKCNKNSYAILLKNDRATRGKTHKVRSKLDRLVKIERIIHKIALDHSIECQTVYPKLFEQKYEKMDKEKIEKVGAFTSDIMNQLMKEKKNFFRQTKKFETFEQLQYVKSIRGKKEAQIAYDALKLFSRQDNDAKYLKKVFDDKQGKMRLNQDKVGELFEKYLVEPCAYYVRELGPDIFIPASYDVAILDKEDRYEQVDENSSFFTGWIRYKFCNLLIGRDRKSLLSSVIKIAIKVPEE